MIGKYNINLWSKFFSGCYEPDWYDDTGLRAQIMMEKTGRKITCWSMIKKNLSYTLLESIIYFT